MENKKLKIVKIGGKIIEDENKLRDFLQDFAQIEDHKILLHGGGSLATELAERLGYQTQMVDGRRITDENSLKVIVMTYAGLINKTIVAKLQALNCNAVGLCGADGKSIVSKKRALGKIDFGFVGDIETVNTSFILSLLEQGITPVFSAISCTKEGELLNTNGDSVAAEIAKAMSTDFETELLYLFGKKGVLKDINDDNSVIEHINKGNYQDLLKEKLINEGMLPKLENCFEALDCGVAKICLGDDKLLRDHSLHTEIVK